MQKNEEFISHVNLCPPLFPYCATFTCVQKHAERLLKETQNYLKNLQGERWVLYYCGSPAIRLSLFTQLTPDEIFSCISTLQAISLYSINRIHPSIPP